MIAGAADLHLSHGRTIWLIFCGRFVVGTRSVNVTPPEGSTEKWS